MRGVATVVDLETFLSPRVLALSNRSRERERERERVQRNYGDSSEEFDPSRMLVS